MNFRALVPAGSRGSHLRKALIAVVFFAAAELVWRLIRDPVWEGWIDAYTWPQLFLGAPAIFFAGAAIGHCFCFIAETTRVLLSRAPQKLTAPHTNECTLTVWFRNSFHIFAMYFATTAIGMIPMSLSYLVTRTHRPMPWRWSSVVAVGLVWMLATWWLFIRPDPKSQSAPADAVG